MIETMIETEMETEAKKCTMVDFHHENYKIALIL
jgi:hypothetical protein